jgi:hypothetical protein
MARQYEKEGIDASNGAGPVLPYELFIQIADALLDSNCKGTLVRMMRATRTVYELCISGLLLVCLATQPGTEKPLVD